MNKAVNAIQNCYGARSSRTLLGGLGASHLADFGIFEKIFDFISCESCSALLG
jgi:hypothetical protein